MATKNGLVGNKVKIGKGPNEIKFFPDRILYIEGNVNYTIFYIDDGRVIYSAKGLSFWEGQLVDFRRIHRKYLVNVSHVKDVGEKSIMMNNGIVLGMSRRKRMQF
jgi:DNA-binding LytR/AlgR family response regulator